MGRLAAAKRAATALVAAGAATLLGGCLGGGPDAPSFEDKEAGGYEARFPAGWKEASPQRFAAFEKSLGIGVEAVAGEEAPPVDLVELWTGRVDGSRVEIDIQTEQLATDSIDLATYDQLSEQTLETVPQIKIDAPTSPYTPFDGEEASITDLSVPLVPRLGNLRIATTVRDGFAYNVELAAPTPALREAATPVLDGVVESWSWDE